jgi:hypothetical protein
VHLSLCLSAMCLTRYHSFTCRHALHVLQSAVACFSLCCVSSQPVCIQLVQGTVETLGSISLLASDKTGNEGIMALIQLASVISCDISLCGAKLLVAS